MPVDRAFTIKGTGTVVTGTIWSGRLSREASVRILPIDRTARVRGLQSHGTHVDVAEPGHRTAVALAGVDLAEVARGSMLVADQGWRPSNVLRAEVALLPDAPQPLRPRTAVRFHIGTSDVGARIIAAGGALAPGERRAARVTLDEPVAVRAGDRFVVRSASPSATIGGGIVVDPFASRRARPWNDAAHSAARRLALALAEAGEAGLDPASLPIRLGVPPSIVTRLLGETGATLVRVAARLYARDTVDAVAARLISLLEEHHRAHQLEPGAPLQSIRSRLTAYPELADYVIARAVENGRVESVAGTIRIAAWTPQLTTEQRRLMDSVYETLAAAGDEPPSVAELTARFGQETADLLRVLEREKRIVAVEAERYYTSDRLTGLVERLRVGMSPDRVLTPAELRDLLGFSRKYLIPFLEYCDRQGFTLRAESGRRWNGT